MSRQCDETINIHCNRKYVICCQQRLPGPTCSFFWMSVLASSATVQNVLSLMTVSPRPADTGFAEIKLSFDLDVKPLNRTALDKRC